MNNKTLKIALLQISPTSTIDGNLTKGIEVSKKTKQLRARAYENMTAIATCNYQKDVPDCNGHSSIFDGVSYLPTLSGLRDTCIFEVDESEGIFVSNLDLNMLRNYREKEVHSNAYRRSEKYTLLLDKKINSPFIRNKKLD